MEATEPGQVGSPHLATQTTWTQTTIMEAIEPGQVGSPHLATLEKRMETIAPGLVGSPHCQVATLKRAKEKKGPANNDQ